MEEDYLSVLAEIKVEEIIERDGGVGLDKLASESLCVIASHASSISMEFFKNRDRQTMLKKSRDKVLHALLDTVKWATAILVFNNFTVVTTEDIELFAEEFNVDLHHDGILASLNILSSISEIADIMYPEDGSPPVEEELTQCVAEICALCCIISNRVDCPFEDLLTGTFM